MERGVELSRERRGATLSSCSSEIMPMSETLEALGGGYDSSNFREARTRAGERMGLDGLGMPRWLVGLMGVGDEWARVMMGALSEVERR